MADDSTANNGSDAPIKMTVYMRLLLKTMIVTYPFALVVLELPNIEAFAFESCSRRACTFMQVFGTGVAPPNESCAKLGLAKAYHVIVNGKMNSACDDTYFLHPVCPSFSQQQMADTCERMDVRSRIINPLQESWLKYAYASAIGGLALFNLLHDFCLIRGMNEFLTLRLGFVSAYFLLMAVFFGFFWSMGVLKVFASEVISDVCACYYVLPELRAILAILTPCWLYFQSIFKLQELNRAILVGDHLYFQFYNVPFTLARQSKAAIDFGSFVVGTAHGIFQAELPERLNLSQVRWLCLLQRVLLVTFFFPVSFSIALAVGPASVRILQFASSEQLPQHMQIAMILGLWAFPSFLLLNLRSLFPCDFIGTLHLEMDRKHPYFTWLLRLVFFTVLVVGLGWATLVLSYELLAEEAPISAEHALLVSEGGMVYFLLGLQVYVWMVELRPSYQAVLIKSRKVYSPHVYIKVAEMHPEYALEEERLLAEEFLQEYQGSNLNQKVNLQRWKARLDQVAPASDLETSSGESA